jgi:hypothetical protein
MTSPTLVGPLLQFFFTDYLIAQRRVSPQTIARYRDTFRLPLQFVDHETGIGPTALPVASLDAGIILRFLVGCMSWVRIRRERLSREFVEANILRSVARVCRQAMPEAVKAAQGVEPVCTRAHGVHSRLK